MVTKHATTIALFMILVMFLFAFMSSAGNPFHSSSNPGDSTTMDELAHIPSGYSYLKYKDYRLNPEHPPLFKDIAALPLMFIDVQFPDTHPSWTEDVNGQWGLGHAFLYDSGNNADTILFWSRLPMMIVMVLLGLLLFFWAKKMWGPLPALVALFLYVLSPTITAHGRYVTTDVPIAFFTTLSFYGLWKFFRNPGWWTFVLSGFLLGCAQLTKFSALLLLPIFGLCVIIFAVSRVKHSSFNILGSAKIHHHVVQNLYVGILSLIGMFVVAFFTIGAVYTFHVWNMPSEKIVELVEVSLYREDFEMVKKGLVALADKNVIFKGYSQYFLGASMVFHRATGGNTTYFLGEVHNRGWWYYFPVTFFLKVPIAIHLLWITSLLMCIGRIYRSVFTGHSERFKRALRLLKNFIESRYMEVFIFLYIVVYVALSIQSNLNIGVRHLIPIFPFMYLLLSKSIRSFIFSENKQTLKAVIGGVLAIWLIVAWVVVYPSYLSYFNESVGGSDQGYHYITDSNVDWGQDLKRLHSWLDKHSIETIHLHYFGGGDPQYELGNRYIEYSADQEDIQGWVALSATNYTLSFEHDPTYAYLDERGELRAMIGNSILIYYIGSE